MIRKEILKTPFGMMGLASEKGAILALDFLWNAGATAETKEKSPLAKKVEKELQEFSLGRRKSFSVRLSPAIKGTEFQEKVWAILKKIPYGRTMTYRDIAVKLGNPYFARGVGRALRTNRVAIIIPCHRVVASNGIGGYSGRKHLDVKKRLLEIEQKNK